MWFCIRSSIETHIQTFKFHIHNMCNRGLFCVTSASSIKHSMMSLPGVTFQTLYFNVNFYGLFDCHFARRLIGEGKMSECKFILNIVEFSWIRRTPKANLESHYFVYPRAFSGDVFVCYILPYTCTYIRCRRNTTDFLFLLNFQTFSTYPEVMTVTSMHYKR